MSWGRISALVMRYAYLYAGSPPRLIELVFWPIMDLIVWSFITTYLSHVPNVPHGVTFLFGAVIMWNVLYRSQLSVSVAFLEDVWTRNLLNLFVSPLRLSELIAALCVVGMGRIALVVLVMGGMAALFWSFNLTVLGWALVPLFVNLLWMGWALGLFAVALFLRYGQAAENLAWGVPFLFQPLSAIFYPVSSLPEWLRPISLTLPSTQVFEGMRDVLAGRGFPTDHMLAAVASNVVLSALIAAFFHRMYNQARNLGLLARLGTQ